jgi:hypothetical protein
MGAKPFRVAGLAMAALFAGALAMTHAAPSVAQEKPKPGAAKDEKEDAKEAYKEGQKKFKAEDYAGALEDFKRADQLYPGAAPKEKIAVCYDKLGKVSEAVAAYKAFIDSDPGEKYAESVAQAKQRIAELEATLPAKVSIKVTPEGAKGMTIKVDGKPVQGTEFELKAGEHTIVVSAEGHQPVTEVVTIKGGETRELAVALTPMTKKPAPTKPVKPKPTTPEEPQEETRSNVPAYVTIGIAGAGIILGTVFGIRALGQKSDFDELADSGTGTAEELTELADEAERSALIADMSFGVALTFGITGAVLLFSNMGSGDSEEEKADEKASSRPVLVPFAGPTGGGMAATWKF